MSRRTKQRRGLSGGEILQQDVFGRRIQGGAGRVEVPTSTWVPLTDGAEPPGFITDGAGNLIFVAYPL